MSPLKKPAVGGSDYCVFQDEQRHTCIRVRCDKAGVWFIPYEASHLDLEFLTNYEFEHRFPRQLEDYPVRRAARMYVAPWQTISPDAKKHLLHLTGGDFPTANTLNFQNKESIMTDEAKAKDEAKKAAPKKAAAPKAEKPTKASAAPKAEKAPAKEAPKKVAAPKATSDGGSKTRVSKEAGKKIKVIDKNPAVRPGSSREAQYKVLLACKTTDEAAEKLRELTDKPWDLVRLAVSAGVIEIY